jgi:hypothetical protein
MMANQLNASLVLNVMLGTPKTKQLIEALLESLKTWDINIKDYRGQTFDNNLVMSGAYSSLQARVKQFNKLLLIIFVP